MINDLEALLPAALTIGFIHTLAGPDHYLPFAAMARARKWSYRRTLFVTLCCGLGHVGGSILLAMIGVALGIGVESLNWIESTRGEWAAWMLIGFGLAYMVWGFWRGLRNKPHSHLHVHTDGTLHAHTHAHDLEHMHVHEAVAMPRAVDTETELNRTSRLNPWVLFTIFVFGPCEPLIPLIMYPAAKHDRIGLFVVTAVFAIVTVGTMLTLVSALYFGAGRVRINWLERYAHAWAGGVVLACGGAVKWGL